MGNISFEPEGVEEGAINAERLVIPFADTVQVSLCSIVVRTVSNAISGGD
jgi:hypothetical protein